MKERNLALDSLKGLAVIGVVKVHANTGVFSGFTNNFIISGGKGVQMFFIISVMLMMKSFFSASSDNNFSMIKWFSRRFIRLIPIYYFVLICTLVTTNQAYSIPNILSHFLFLHGFNPYWTGSIISICWYLGTLTIFTLCIPIICKYINTFKKSIYLFVITSALSIGIRGIALFTANLDDYSIHSFWGAFSFITQAPVATIGVILYFIVYKEDTISKIKRHIRNKNKALISFASLVLLYILYTVENLFGYGYIIHSSIFALIILSQLVYESKIICNRLFATIGRYSYGIYLTHLFYLTILSQHIPHRTSEGLYYIILLSCTILCSFITSFVLTHLLETPFVKLFSKIIN